MKHVFAGFLGLLLLTGCASQGKKGLDPNGAVVTSMTDLPPPTAADRYEHSPAYTVGPFDELTVSVFGVEDLSGDVTADAQGNVAVPLAGTINASNMTQIELASAIAQKLSRYVKDPHVTVNVKNARSRTITIDGQVKDPGIFQANSNLSLMRAIATAKGTTEDADVKDVVIFRTVGGQRMAALYNLGAIRRGTYADPPVYPNDIVVVGDSPTTRTIRQIAPVAASPLILLLQALLP
jgi:polysaccharide export outer membrane protein